MCRKVVNQSLSINYIEAEKKPTEKKSADAPPKKKKKTELSLREEIEQEMQDGPGEPPTVSVLYILIHFSHVMYGHVYYAVCSVSVCHVYIDTFMI